MSKNEKELPQNDHNSENVENNANNEKQDDKNNEKQEKSLETNNIEESKDNNIEENENSENNDADKKDQDNNGEKDQIEKENKELPEEKPHTYESENPDSNEEQKKDEESDVNNTSNEHTEDNEHTENIEKKENNVGSDTFVKNDNSGFSDDSDNLEKDVNDSVEGISVGDETDSVKENSETTENDNSIKEKLGDEDSDNYDSEKSSDSFVADSSVGVEEEVSNDNSLENENISEEEKPVDFSVPVSKAPVPKSNEKIPKFNSRPVKEENNAYKDEFESIKEKFKKSDKGTEALDREERRGFVIRAGFTVLVIALLVPIAYIVYTMIEDSQQPQTNREEAIAERYQGEDLLGLGLSGAAAQENIMYEIAIVNGYDFSEVNPMEKEVFFIEQSVGSTITPRQLTVGSDFKFQNTTNCFMDNPAEFCYIAEVKRGDNIVGNLYTFSDIFQTKFFGEVQNPNEVPVNGVDFAAVGSANISGDDKTTLFLADRNGLGYVFVLDDSSQINDLVANVSYGPSLPE